MNQRGLDRLDPRIDKPGSEMDARFSHRAGRVDRIQADLAQVYRIFGEHGARLDISRTIRQG